MGVVVSAQVANPAPDIYVCDVDNDSYTVFDLTVNDTSILGGQNSADFTVTYYETVAEADVGVGEINTSVLYQNVDINGDGNGDSPQVIYVRVEENATGNYDATGSFNINVLQSPILPADPLVYSLCDNDGNNDGIAVFDLVAYGQTVLFSGIVATGGNISDYSVGYYVCLDGSGNVQPACQIGMPTAYENTTTPDQVIYAEVVNTLTGCSTVKEITLHVALLPTANYTPIEVCDNNGNNDGVAVFNLTDNIPNITSGATDVDVSFYLTQADAEAGIGNSLISDPTAFTNTVNPQAIFARVYSPTLGCYAIAIVNLHVNPNPTPFTTAEIAANL